MKSPFDTDFLNENLMGALLASFLYLGDWSKIIPRVSTLPDVPMRRQVIKKTRNSVVVNDSAGTSPDATIALLAEYKKIPKNQKILITGGTDKQLDFSVWPNHIKKELMSSNVYFLNGSATQKMVSGLKKVHFFNKGEKPNRYEDLKDIVEVISRRKGKKTILFSPSSASFEKFKNEFDRGNQFSRFVRTLF
jgi:UDP-N-acetylmuramoylalanine--D-glutamate ligase